MKHPYKYKEIPVGEICVDKRYQRDEKSQVIKCIVNEFDYHKVNPVKVVSRDGKYYAFDGQQTTIGLMKLFGADYCVPCMIYYDVPTWVNEAELFEGINSKRGRIPVTDAELWHSRINREDQNTMDIIQIVEDAGLRVSVYHGKDAKAIKALTALDYIYNKYDQATVREALEIISDAFNGDSNSLQSTMLRGMALFVNLYRGQYDKRQLINRLNKNGAVSIIRAGKASAADGKTKYAREILSVYNAGRKIKLPDLF